MIATSRLIVILRRELGRQQSLAQIKLNELPKPTYHAGKIPTWENDKVEPSLENVNKDKDILEMQGIIQRLEKATQALGGIQLGDIKDNEFLISS